MEMKEDRYYQAIIDVAKTINSTLDRQEVLRATVENTTAAMGAKGCSLMLLSPDHLELYHTVACGLSEWYLRKGPVSVDASIADALLGHPTAILDAGTDPRVQYRPQAIREGIASILCVPICLRDDVIGVMRVYTAEPREFSAEDIAFAKALADLAAIAFENARRYEEVQDNYAAVRQDLLEWYATWGLERSADAVAGGVAE